MDDLETKFTEALRKYEVRTDLFMEVDVHCSLQELFPPRAPQLPAQLLAEVLAFSFIENHQQREDGWGTYFGPMFSSPMADGSVQDYPSLSQVTPSVLEHWATRAGQVKHPLLLFRYAGLAWVFGATVKEFRRHPDLARKMVGAALAIAEQVAAAHAADDSSNLADAHHWLGGFQKLAYAHNVAVGLNDAPLVEAVRKALIAFEERTARDHLPGTWGRCFDLLVVNGNKRFPLTEEQRHQLVEDLETRMQRNLSASWVEQLNPVAVEGGALRLAAYYRKRQQSDDVRRVLQEYARAYLSKAEVTRGLAAASTLQKVFETLSGYGLQTEADEVACHYQRHAKRSAEEMSSITHTTTIPNETMEELLRPWTEGEVFEQLVQFALQFTPQRADAEQQVREQAKQAPLSQLVSTSIVDHSGRETGRVGPAEDDLEGHIIKSISQSMQLASPFIRLVVERLVSARGLDANRVVDFLAMSPVFELEQRPILVAGLRAYFERDWVPAIHILVPQIESGIRRLVQISGRSPFKQGRNGGMPFRTLDDLLRDEQVEQVLGSDTAAYFRILLTDQRAWNVRNNVCHGLASADYFNQWVADRLLHALMCLGRIRAGQESSNAPPADAGSAPTSTQPSATTPVVGADRDANQSSPSECDVTE